jgi:YHS domain-containing protein
MDVTESSPFKAEHDHQTYYFCSESCRARFSKNPNQYLQSASHPEPSAGAGSEKVRQHGRGAKFTDYIPLVVIVVLTLLAASAKQYSYFQGTAWSWMAWMHDFMGFFLVVFSMFKFFNMEGFADGFQMYDLLAKRLRPYAYLYPFIELALGLGYLAHWRPTVVYSVTIVVTVFGSLGVFAALRRKLDIECACMGTVLKVPLSTVALVEDLGMAAMAAAMLLI